jgi:hypothetical protein
VASPSERSDEAAWSELEQSFFAAAPPDDPPAAPTYLDDSPRMAPRLWRHRLRALRQRALTGLAATRATLHEAVRRLRAVPSFAALKLPTLNRRGVAIALASAIVLMGLSAGVVASRSAGSAGAPAASEPSAPAVPRDTEAGAAAAVRTRTSDLRPHTRASKHSHAHAATTKHARRQQHKVATGHARE